MVKYVLGVLFRDKIINVFKYLFFKIFCDTLKYIVVYYTMNKYLVEFLGTMFLTFVIFATGNYLAIGAALAIGVLLGGAISGGAFNPAVAIALSYAGKISQNDLSPYIVAEIAGGLACFQLVKFGMNK